MLHRHAYLVSELLRLLLQLLPLLTVFPDGSRVSVAAPEVAVGAAPVPCAGLWPLQQPVGDILGRPSVYAAGILASEPVRRTNSTA